MDWRHCLVFPCGLLFLLAWAGEYVCKHSGFVVRLFSRCLGTSASGRPVAWFSTPPLFQNGGWETPPHPHVGAGRAVSWAGSSAAAVCAVPCRLLPRGPPLGSLVLSLE